MAMMMVDDDEKILISVSLKNVEPALAHDLVMR